MSVFVLAAYYCRGRAERRERRREERLATSVLDGMATSTFRLADLDDPSDVPVCCVCLDEFSDGKRRARRSTRDRCIPSWHLMRAKTVPLFFSAILPPLLSFPPFPPCLLSLFPLFSRFAF